ncbi:MAG: excinuclease ABC subunit UvrC [Bacteroidetes bacterium]|nr:excinuclease ABC subunit UvrC [Bacteroidota bacterium]
MSKFGAHIDSILATMPDAPGIYQFFNKASQIIYVGKAKNLKKRVYSYFAKEVHDSGKTTILVKQIEDIRYLVVETEQDALLLENNLIKKHQPRYNVLLKDDKTFPWVCIKKERFPRVFTTRKYIKDGSQYFGPYTNVKMVHTLLELVGALFKLRNCNLLLSEENIAAGKFRVCLEYHVGNCLGPCESHQSESDYQAAIKQIREILKGNINTVIGYLEELMQQYASGYEYEQAQLIKEKIQMLEHYRSKSVVVSSSIHNVDVFSIINKEKVAYVNFLKIINGAIIQTHTLEMRKKLDETDAELLELAIVELRNRYHSDAREVLVNTELELELEGVTFVVPKIGDKKHLISLSLKNLFYYIREQETKMDKLDPEHRIDRLMNQMKTDLRMKEQPRLIECFDNSNIQGAFPVAAMSVFRDGKPAKSEYRHFNIKTVEGPNDFASMEEVIERRYSRVMEENLELPQLIVIDGGKGQLSAAVTSLKKVGVYGKVTVIGIAKKLEEIYFPEDSVPIYLDKKGETLRTIQQIRDEVHRFGITHHRNRRSKSFTSTGLSEIKGVGSTTATEVLRHFRSLKRVREADLSELEEIVGKSKAHLIFNHFHPQELPPDVA